MRRYLLTPIMDEMLENWLR